VRQGHPWIFSGAIEHIDGTIADGDFAAVVDSSGHWLARGYVNRRSQIQVRLLSWSRTDMLDDDGWRRRLATAIAIRGQLPDLRHTDAYRLIHAENDYLPGLTVDRYGDYLVLQAGTLAIDQRKQRLAAMLHELTGCQGVVERSEMAVRRQEGLEAASGMLVGTAPNGPIEVKENGLRFLVDLVRGQKTGFYTDQRTNRQRVAAYCAGRQVLNAFSYTGAFAAFALGAGAAHVLNIDSSVDALELAEANLRLNGFDPDTAAEQIVGDVFAVLHDWRAQQSTNGCFDVIILDPPKFAQSQQHMERALRGYKEINLLALQLLKPGGILATFSCSGLVSADLFQKVVFGAAVDAGRQVQILEWLRQSSDHPVAITFPEGEYLKGLICRVA
jgi:23S rRNA (cytosine1962-C5)-methyltransferase